MAKKRAKAATADGWPDAPESLTVGGIIHPLWSDIEQRYAGRMDAIRSFLSAVSRDWPEHQGPDTEHGRRLMFCSIAKGLLDAADAAGSRDEVIFAAGIMWGQYAVDKARWAGEEQKTRLSATAKKNRTEAERKQREAREELTRRYERCTGKWSKDQALKQMERDGHGKYNQLKKYTTGFDPKRESDSKK